jgi:hypothetical protein
MMDRLYDELAEAYARGMLPDAGSAADAADLLALPGSNCIGSSAPWICRACAPCLAFCAASGRKA